MIIQSLVNRHNSEIIAGRAMPYGVSNERVRWAIILSSDGAVLDVEDMQVDKTVPRLPMPTPPPGRTSGIKPRTYHDKCSFVLGVPVENKKDRSDKEHAAWIAHHRELIGETDDAGLCALLAFLTTWKPDQINALPQAEDIKKGDLIAFRLEGDTDDAGKPRFISDRSEAQRLSQAHLAAQAGETGICQVTGDTAPIARLHTPIKSVPGTSTSGARLVSSNAEATNHYGRTQGTNAGISQGAAHAYASTLQALLHDQKHRVRIGDGAAVFWVEGAGDGQAAEDLLGALLSGGGSQADEGQETNRVRETLRQIALGRPLVDADPGLDPGATYHLLCLAGAEARLIVRWHLVGTLGELADRVGQHWQDLALDPLPWRTPPSVQWLALQTVPVRSNGERDDGKLNPTLPADILQAVLTGIRYPSGLLQTLVTRLGTDRAITATRITLIKACLARDARLNSMETPPMSLDPDNPSPAYQLGRLFAVLENAYQEANPKSERSLSDGSYRLASVQPAAAFPRLLATTKHHLSAIKRRNGKEYVSKAIDGDIGTIMDRLQAAFPPRLSVSEQGLFALGYYQQRAYRKPAASENSDPKSTSAPTATSSN